MRRRTSTTCPNSARRTRSVARACCRSARAMCAAAPSHARRGARTRARARTGQVLKCAIGRCSNSRAPVGARGHAPWRRGPVRASAFAARVTVRRRAVSRLQVLKCEIGRCSNSRALAAHPRTWLRQAARGGLGCEVTCPQRHHRLFEAIRCGFDSIGAAAPLASVAVLPRPVSASISGQCRLCERRGAPCGAACADSACFRTR